MRDSIVVDKIKKQLLDRRDVVAEVMRMARALPEDWRTLPLGEALRWLRRRLRLRQKHAALLAGMSQSQVAKLEKGGDFRLSTIEKLLKGYGCGWVLLPLSAEEAEVLSRRNAKRFPRYSRIGQVIWK